MQNLKIKMLTVLTVLTMIFALSCNVLSAKTWQQAILDVESLKLDYQNIIYDRTGEWPSEWQGAMNDNKDSSEHFCAILGRRLGFKDQISHLEPPQPSFDSDVWELTLHTVSLSNWVYAAIEVGGLDPTQRAHSWNLECIGTGLVSGKLYLAIPEAVWYEVAGSQLTIYGDIVSDFSVKLEQALKKNTQVTTVALGSGGGSVYEAIRAVAIIRSQGLDTQLYGPCMSACPLVFLGGVNRNMYRFSKRFGFHKVSINGRAVPESDDVYEDIGAYMNAMGGNPQLYIATMLAYEPNEMGNVTPYEECMMGLATWWQGYNRGECPRAGAP